MSRIDLWKAPSNSHVIAALGIAMGISGIAHGANLAAGHKPRTMADDWVKANKEYMKFQNMNPIFGISREKWDKK